MFMIEVGLERLEACGQGSCSVHARQGQCACRDAHRSLLPSAAAGAFPL